jgi:hypothetical protein
MNRPGGVFLLVCICFLLVIILGAVESGRVAGADYKAGYPFLSLNFSGWTRFHNTVNITTTVRQSTHGAPNLPPVSPSQNPFISFASLVILPTVPAWLLTVLAVACFAGACILVLRLKTSETVIDLEETVKEMELQQKHLAETWSYKLRNMALLRYYLLMRRACSKVGLQEKITETPKEYIERAAAFLKVDGTYSIRFADAVNRCRYGEELSREDASEASKFMGDFTEVIRRKADAP